MELEKKLQNKSVLLASGSPRRHALLAKINVDFEIVKQDVEESYPMELKGGEVAKFLAEKKANSYLKLEDDDVLITADTIVWHQGKVLNKPKDRSEAIDMLSSLSDSQHEVFTGVAVKTTKAMHAFYDSTMVTFNKLSQTEIIFYVDNYQPFDKAGAYGIQDWIGYIGINRIEGCYYNVMGLPIPKLYAVLIGL